MPSNINPNEVQWDAEPSKMQTTAINPAEVVWDVTPSAPVGEVAPPTPEWAAKYPTAYGVLGAAGETLGLMSVGETIGKTAAYLTRPEGLTSEVAKEAGLKPTTGELAGAALQTGAILLPYGKIAEGAGMVVGKVVSPAIAKLAGKTAAGALGGYMYEAGGKLQKGETPTPGWTTALGATIPAAGTAMSKAVDIMREKAPARIVNSLIKPLYKDFAYGKNPGRVVAEEKIVADSFDELAAKISDKRKEIGGKLGDISQTLSDAAKFKRVTVDISKSLAPIDSAIENAAKSPRTNEALIKRLTDAKKDLMGVVTDADGAVVFTRKLDSLTFNGGLEIKKTVGDITKWTGNASDDKLVNSALKKTWGNIKRELNNTAEKVAPDLAPEYQKMNEKYADITSAEIATKHRDKMLESKNLVSLPGHLGAVTAAIGMFVKTGGQVLPSLLAGAGGAVLDTVLASPSAKTRMAAWLSKATPAQLGMIERKAPKFAAALQRAYKDVKFPSAVLLASKTSRKNDTGVGD